MPSTILAPIGQDLTLDKYFSLASHNSFEQANATNIEDIFPYTKCIELDIWDSEIASGFLTRFFKGKRMEYDWYVKHSPKDKGNNNCCGGSFRNCLTRIKKWSELNPDHDVFTIFIDKKENWCDSNETRNPINLDSLLITIFGFDNIYSPAKILSENKTLRDFVKEKNWPTLSSLKNKFVFVITDSTYQLISKRSPLNEYLKERNKEAICFIAPEINSINEIDSPILISNNNIENVVFYNLNYKNRNLGKEINSKKYMSRIYECPEDIETYEILLSQRINYIAMNRYTLMV